MEQLFHILRLTHESMTAKRMPYLLLQLMPLCPLLHQLPYSVLSHSNR